MTYALHDLYSPYDDEEPLERRSSLRNRPEAEKARYWKERQPDDVLPDLELAGGRVRRGVDRCGAVHLPLGDCRERRAPESAYCFYHRKLHLELTTPSALTYPVWPLPEFGYHISEEE